MFSHVFINRLKVLLRNKSMIFWTLIFPIALGTFFNLAFSNLNKEEQFKPIKIAVIDNQNYREEVNFKTFIEEVSKDNKNQVFDTEYVSSKEEAKEMLDNNEVVGYIIIDDKASLVVKSNGLSQTIIKSVIDNYYQTVSVIGHIVEFNPEALKNEVLEKFNDNDEYFVDASGKNNNSTVMYFYTLIGMMCIYGGFFGVNAINETEANLSKRGARINVAPTHKIKVLLASLLVALVVHYAEVLIVMGYLMFILGIEFGSQIGYILLLALVGSLAGISLGAVVGAASKKSEDAKAGILVSVTMLCSFLSGMMMAQMKYIISQKVPLIGFINPVNMITDGLYALYYYETLNRYIWNVMSLIVFFLIMIVIVYFLIRRKSYDSI